MTVTQYSGRGMRSGRGITPGCTTSPRGGRGQHSERGRGSYRGGYRSGRGTNQAPASAASHRWVRPTTAEPTLGKIATKESTSQSNAAQDPPSETPSMTVAASSSDPLTASEQLQSSPTPSVKEPSAKADAITKKAPILKGPAIKPPAMFQQITSWIRGKVITKETRPHKPAHKTNQWIRQSDEVDHKLPAAAEPAGMSESNQRLAKQDGTNAITTKFWQEPLGPMNGFSRIEPAKGLHLEGRNKLVLAKQQTTDSEAASLGAVGSKEDASSEMRFLSSKRGRKRPRPAPVPRGPKRIKVAVPAAEQGDTTVAGERNSSHNDGEQEAANATTTAMTEKLTDFAYRETSSAAVSKRGRGRGRGRGGRGGRSMGLVRVLPDRATTPICPSFLRGVTCMNPKCGKRHDVPKETTLPVCSYFQSHGMCLKENCPFRHIKINPRAEMCPSFSLLGFCEDSTCTMQHTRSNRNSNNLVWKG